jgi:hypothetical protein
MGYYTPDTSMISLRVRFNFGVKIRRLSYKYLSVIDFWRRGFAPPPKILSLLRPIGAIEIIAPTLERTLPGGCVSTLGKKKARYHANAFSLSDFCGEASPHHKNHLFLRAL